VKPTQDKETTMADPIETRPKTNWLWIAVIVLLAIVLIVVFLDPMGDTDPADVAATNETVPTDSFVAEPAGPAVPVDLPEATLAAPTETPEAGLPATPAPGPAATPTP
jgi:hypothetical protein